MNTFKNYCLCKKGDIVKVTVDVMLDKREYIGEVVNVKNRYECINNGITPSAPLLTINTGEAIEYLDSLFPTEIVVPAIFINNKPNHFKFEKSVICKKRGQWCGGIQSLVVSALSSVKNCTLDRWIKNSKELYHLFKNSGFPGLTKCINFGHKKEIPSIMYVNKKVFKRWVEKNAVRLQYTIKNQTAEATKSNSIIEREYWESLENEDWT